MIFYLFGLLSCFFFSTITAERAGRIIGGGYANDAQFKYQVFLQTDYGRSFCGGAIIANEYVLTAAHCVTKAALGDPLIVIAGTIDMITKKGKPVTVPVQKVYTHKGYTSDRNDIAVLKLQKALDLGQNSHLSTVELPKKGDTYNGKLAIVSGYGLTTIKTWVDPDTKLKFEVGGSTDKKLKYAPVKIEKCQELEPQNISSVQICGKVVQRQGKPEGVCTGDSGGPIVYGNVVIGIVSTNPLGCEEDKQPASYTRVSAFIPFIHSIMNGYPTEDAVVYTLSDSRKPSSPPHAQQQQPL